MAFCLLGRRRNEPIFDPAWRPVFRRTRCSRAGSDRFFTFVPGSRIEQRNARNATEMSSDPSASSIFPRTDWAELSKAAENDEARLDRLIRLYWEPLRIFFLATFPTLREQAETLLQEFAEDKILKQGWLSQADQ